MFSVIVFLWLRIYIVRRILHGPRLRRNLIALQHDTARKTITNEIQKYETSHKKKLTAGKESVGGTGGGKGRCLALTEIDYRVMNMTHSSSLVGRESQFDDNIEDNTAEDEDDFTQDYSVEGDMTFFLSHMVFRINQCYLLCIVLIAVQEYEEVNECSDEEEEVEYVSANRARQALEGESMIDLLTLPSQFI